MYRVLRKRHFFDMSKRKKRYYDSRIKRGLDILGALSGIILSLPVYLLVPVLIKLTSKGPVFYLQERLGKDKVPFMMIKFRTMIVGAENGKPLWAEKNDSRATSVGLFLRKTRIDELPQFINVLKGDMSLVGPRPEREYFVSKLASDIPFYNVRFILKPGISGWAQVNHRYASTVSESRTKLHYDIAYIRNSSLFLDIVILLKTVRCVLNMRGR